MPLKRMLSPDIWTDEGFIELSPMARLLFIGLISQADDYGRGCAGALTLRSKIFPVDPLANGDMDQLCTEVAGKMRVQFYAVDGRQYYQLDRWTQHQYVQRPGKSTIPLPQEHVEPFTEASVNAHGTLTPNEIEKNRKEKNRTRAPAAAVPATSERPLYHLILDAFTKHATEFDFKREGPHVKALEEKALARDPPEAFAKAVLVTFWRLIHGQDPFWRKQPFLPSVLNSGGIWPRVLKELENGQEAAADYEAADELAARIWRKP